MPVFPNAENLHKIVILNPKGGSGKTTLAVNIAGYLASSGRNVTLLDMDPQGSSRVWLRNRPETLPRIRAVTPPADESAPIQLPADTEYLVIDSPAGVSGEALVDYTCGVHAILIPVMSSEIDIHAASRLISELLLKAQVSRRNGRLGIVANRVKERTIGYRRLRRFLDRLSIELVGILRDSQNYLRTAANGRCIHEMAPYQVRKDLEQWEAITGWLEERLATPLTKRDWLRPETTATHKPKFGPITFLPAAAAAAAAALAVALWFFAGMPTDSSEPETAINAQAAPVMTPVLQADTSPAVVSAPADAPEAISGAEALQDRWKLTGVARSNGESVLIFSDRKEKMTVHLTSDGDLDGWSVKDSGTDYVVLAMGTDEVWLGLAN